MSVTTVYLQNERQHKTDSGLGLQATSRIKCTKPLSARGMVGVWRSEHYVPRHPAAPVVTIVAGTKTKPT